MMGRVPKSADARAYDEALGRRVAGARKASGMKCRELAAAAGITEGSLYWYECGRTSLPPVVLARISAALNVSVVALLPKCQ